MRQSVAAGKRVRINGTLHTASKAVCVEDGNIISTRSLTHILGVETYKGQPDIGVVVRADRANNDTLLGSAAASSSVPAGERIYHLEFPMFWPYAFSAQQLADYQAPYAEMILHLIGRHHARPHLGKNRSDIFASPIALAANAERRALFQPFIDEMDADGVFANDFLRQSGFSWPREDLTRVPAAPPR